MNASVIHDLQFHNVFAKHDRCNVLSLQTTVQAIVTACVRTTAIPRMQHQSPFYATRVHDEVNRRIVK